jgi:hypothetical protein
VDAIRLAFPDDAAGLPAQLQDQLAWHWTSQLRDRLDGLTDTEYFWEPTPASLPVAATTRCANSERRRLSPPRDPAGRLDAQQRHHKKLAAAVRASGTSLTGLFGVGPVIAGTVIDVRQVFRFPGRDHLAAYNGTAPVELSSGGRKVFRLSLRGNCRPNHAIHMAAISQIRHKHSDGRAYYEKKVAEGKTHKEALRALVIHTPGDYKPVPSLHLAQLQRVGQQPHSVSARRPHPDGFKVTYRALAQLGPRCQLLLGQPGRCRHARRSASNEPGGSESLTSWSMSPPRAAAGSVTRVVMPHEPLFGRPRISPARSPSRSGSGRRSRQRSGPVGTVDDHPPSAVGAGLPDRDVVEGDGGRLAVSGWNLQGDGAHHIAEVP